MNTKKVFSIFLILFLGLGMTSQAQLKKKKADEVKRMIWKPRDPVDKLKIDDSQYKDESAVIIYQKSYYKYRKRNKYVYTENYFRRRIKILDQASLDEYSNFKYNEGKYYPDKYRAKGVNYFNIKIIKPNKKVIKIDVKKNTVKEDGKKKLAIPNLEIGDIVDYYYYNYESFKTLYGYRFRKVMSSLKTTYPIIKQDLIVDLHKTFYFDFASLNGAPELKKWRSNDKDSNVYAISMENVKPREAKSRVYPLLAYPSIKFQVYFAPNSKLRRNMYGFLAKEKGVVKKSVSKNEVLESFKDDFKPGKISGKKRFHKEIKSFKKRLELYYERMRYSGYTVYLPYYVHKKIKGFMGKAPLTFTDYSNDYNFHSALNNFLVKEKIKHDILLVKYRPNGGNKDLLLKENLQFVTKSYLPNGEVMYLQSLSEDPLFALPGELEALFEGNTAYALKLDAKGRVSSIEETKLPISKPEDNVVEKNTNIDINDKFDKIMLSQTINATGNRKADIRSGVISLFDIYMDDKIANTKNKSKKHKKIIGRRKKSFLNALKAAIAQDRKDRLDNLKDYNEETYKVKIEDYDFGIDKKGRTLDERDFQYHESFTIKEGLTKKAGRNVLLLAGKLIGRQMHIDEKDMKRTEDIYRGSPTLTKYTINITIPNAYTVKGLSKFNKSVKNETGSFVSTAKQEGNKIIIHVEEAYFHIFDPNANWKKMVEVLQTSYQFTQEKLLLKK